jgi:hypothetical protein
MISDLNDKPYAEVIAMLERLAEKNDLLLSSNLIDFADDLWGIATSDVSKLVSALASAIKLAYENAPEHDINNFGVGDEDFTDRLNALQGVLAEWEAK